MSKVTLTTAAIAVALVSGCGGATGLAFQPSYGIVVKYEAMPGATTKYGVNALSDTGRRLFGPAALESPSKLGFGGGTSSYGGGTVPKWVRVTWRVPVPGHITATTGKFVETLDFGAVIGDYKVDIASRLPPEVLKYATGRGRTIRLIFRLKDDGVLLAWDVQEAVHHPSGGSGQVYSLHGGDFSCAELAKPIGSEDCTSDYLKDASWYNPLWTSN